MELIAPGLSVLRLSKINMCISDETKVSYPAVNELSCGLQLCLPMGAEHFAAVIILLFTAYLKQDANELDAKRDHRLFLFQRIVPARREVQVQRAEFRVLGHHRQCRPVQQGPEATATTLADGRFSFVEPGAVFPQAQTGVSDDLLAVVVAAQVPDFRQKTCCSLKIKC